MSIELFMLNLEFNMKASKLKEYIDHVCTGFDYTFSFNVMKLRRKIMHPFFNYDAYDDCVWEFFHSSN